MSQRHRSGRGSARNNENTHGEEAQIWESAKTMLAEIVTGVNSDNNNLEQVLALDKELGALEHGRKASEKRDKLEELCRKGVKLADNNLEHLKNVQEHLKVMRAVIVAKEDVQAQAAGPGKRTAARESATAAIYDFENQGESSAPSPMSNVKRKVSERASTRGADRERAEREREREQEKDRDSIPPGKADSVEPQGSTGSGAGSAAGAAAAAAANQAKSKVTFSKGDIVAFRPKAGAGGDSGSDWILGEVAQVLGEGKSRRYKVLDVEPEDQSKQKEYRSSASSMIPITPESQATGLKDWEADRTVLALYPNTTTFYRAEVHSTDENGKVNLKFEGENDSSTLQQVERRFVVEFRA